MIKNKIFSLSNSMRYARFYIHKSKFISYIQQSMITEGVRCRLTFHSNLRPNNSECSELWKTIIVHPFKLYRKVCKYDSAFNRKEYYKPFCEYGIAVKDLINLKMKMIPIRINLKMYHIK